MDLSFLDFFGILFIGIMILIVIEDLYMLIDDVIAFLIKHHRK